jgi:putative tricarboxylic transport membrane protein
VLEWLISFANGFGVLLELTTLLAALLGILVGVTVGAIPGLGVAVAIAVSIPFTFTMPAVPVLAYMLGIYKAGTYGGSISAILMNTPGTPAAAATVLDGYPMAQKGKPVKALRIALVSSVVADLLSIMVLVIVAEPLARIALRFGPIEIVSLLLFSLTVVAAISGANIWKGLMAASVGIMLATIGFDPIAGVGRFDFGVPYLSDGVAIIPMLVGLFAISEVLLVFEKGTAYGGVNANELANAKDDELSWQEIRGLSPIFLRASAIGTSIGTLPGIGSTVAAFLSYADAMRRSKTPEEFGKGSPEGLAAAESGNNAVIGGALIPLLTLGIPGDVITAILLGVLTLQGITLGPLIFELHREFVFSIFAILILSSGMLYLVGHYTIRALGRFTRFDNTIVFPVVFALCVIGTYTIRGSMLDVWAMLFFGVVGTLMRKADVPIAPLLITFVLIERFEQSLRQSLIIGRGDYSVFITSPISALFLCLTAFAVFSIVRTRRRNRVPQKSPTDVEPTDSGRG